MAYPETELEGKLINLGLTQKEIEEVVLPHGGGWRVDEAESLFQERPVVPKGGARKEGTPVTVRHPQADERLIPEFGKASPTIGAYRPIGHEEENWGVKDRPGSPGEIWRHAQESLRLLLQESLHPVGWQVHDSQVRDEHGRETDIQLDHGQFGQFHVEVKQIKGSQGQLFWSENEVDKAKDHPGSYFLAITHPCNDEGDMKVNGKSYRIRWVWDPLNQLLLCSRQGQWKWAKEEPATEDLGGGWDVPSPRKEMPATAYLFRVEISMEFMNQLPSGIKALEIKLSDG